MSIVKPSGNPFSDVYIVGEKPSFEEVSTRENFSGTDGRTLRGMLSKVGFVPESLRYGNVSFSFGGGTNDVEELKTDILSHPRKVILIVGEKALNALCDRTHISKWRGSFISTTMGIPAIPTFLPSFIREGNWEHILSMRSDCSKLMKVRMGTFSLPKREFMSFSRGATFSDFVDELERLSSLRGKLISYDIEGLYPHMSCISFSDHPSRAVSVPLETSPFNLSQRLILIEKINAVLMNPLNAKVFCYGIYDNTVLRKYGIGATNLFMDLNLAHKTLFHDLPHDLAYLTSVYTWEPFYKDDRTLSELEGDSKKADDYSCMDAAVTREIADPLLKELTHAKLDKFFFEKEMPKVWSATLHSTNGLPILKNVRSTIRDEVNNEISLLKGEISKVTPTTNPASPKQVMSFMYDELNMKKVYRNRKGPNGRVKTLTSDDDAVRECIKRYPQHRSVLNNILNLRKKEKELSTYIDARSETLPDGSERFMYGVNISGTNSGRYSVSLLLNNTGIPAQGIPKSLRRMIGIDSLLTWEADASQAEARVVAWISGEEHLIRSFLAGEDVHKKTAHLLFDVPINDVTKLQRDLAKRIKHATNYRIGPRKLVDVVLKFFPEYQFDEKTSKFFISKLRELYPETTKWQDVIEEKVNRGQRDFRSHYGRRRFLFGPINDDLIRSAISFIPQSDVGDLTTISMCEVQRKIIKSGVDPKKNFCINLVHDSIVGICEEENVSLIKSIVQGEMSSPIPNLNFKGIPLCIPCEFSVGPNWMELKKVED